MADNEAPFILHNTEASQTFKAVDWNAHPLGPIKDWPVTLKTTLGIIFNSRHPMFLFWGEDHIQFYNDAYLPSFGVGKHPKAMGQKGQECWPEIWTAIQPQIEDVMVRGVASWNENQLLPIFRNGKMEDVYWTYSYSPVIAEGKICGVMVVCTETTKQVVAEKDLKDQKTWLEDVLEKVPAGIILADKVSGKIEFANEAAQRMSGGLNLSIGDYDAKSYQGFDAAGNEVSRADLPRARALRGEKLTDYEFNWHTPNGKFTFLISTEMLPASYERAPTVLLSMTDITLQKQAEKSRNSEADKLKYITDLMPAFVSYLDDQFRYEWTNNTYERFFGLKSDELKGKSLEEVAGSEAFKVSRPFFEKALQGISSKFSTEIKDKNGKPAIIQVEYVPNKAPNGIISGIIVLGHDVSEEARARKTLEESEEKLNIALLSAKIGFWDWNAQTGHVELSETLMQDWGIDPEKFQHTLPECLDLIHPEDRERVWSEIEKSTFQKQPYDVEYRVIRPSGELIWVNAKGKYELDEKGQPKRLLGVTINITGNKVYEEKMREALETRDEFLSIASHELKTPLTSLKIQSQIQLRQLRDNHPDVFSKERMEKASVKSVRLIDRLDRLINDMLDISRIRTGKLAIQKSSVNLNTVVKEAIERMQEFYDTEGKEKILFMAATKAEISCDPLRIDQVVSNLLLNALKYGNGKNVEVRVENIPGALRVRVSDKGPGITQELQKKIFERFARAVSASEISGLGLGLFISEQIIAAHDGKIWVESEPGAGARFCFELPL